MKLVSSCMPFANAKSVISLNFLDSEEKDVTHNMHEKQHATHSVVKGLYVELKSGCN